MGEHEAEPASATRWVILAVGILAVSTASVLIRLANAPPLVVGAWRMVLAATLLAPWALPAARREWSGLERRDWLRIVLAALALATHFATWITSLSYTTVASSVILVSTNPIWVGLATRYLLREPVRRAMLLGIVIAMLGTAIVSYGELGFSGRALLGNALAVAGAVSASAYILLGRAVRAKLSTWAYVWPCYGLAGLALVVVCLVAGQPLWGYGPNTWLAFFLLATGPQILGHSAFNWALAHFSAIFVTLAILGEPIGATLLALLLLGEKPGWTALVGGALILSGIWLASRGEAVSDRTRVSRTQGERA